MSGHPEHLSPPVFPQTLTAGMCGGSLKGARQGMRASRSQAAARSRRWDFKQHFGRVNLASAGNRGSPLPFASRAGASLTPPRVCSRSWLLSPSLNPPLAAEREARLFPGGSPGELRGKTFRLREPEEGRPGAPAPCLPTRCGRCAAIETGSAAFAAFCPPLRRRRMLPGHVRRRAGDDGCTDPIPTGDGSACATGGVKRGESRREPFLARRVLGSSRDGEREVRKPTGTGLCKSRSSAGQSRLRPCSCAPPKDLLLIGSRKSE